MPLYNKVGLVVALIALALFASFALPWPTHPVVLSGLSFSLSGKVLLGLLAVGLAGVGADAIVRSQTGLKPRQLRRTFLWCILPTAITTATWLLLARLPNLEARVAGIVASAGALAMLISAEYEAQGPATRWRRAVETTLQLATYAAAALLCGAVYPTSLHATAARAATVVSVFVALRLLGGEKLPLWRILGASAGIALLLGVISWLLYPQVTSALTYSLTLVVFLYMLAGLARQFLSGQLCREVVVEYLLVGLAALVLLLLATR